jgi:hypothetical protein
VRAIWRIATSGTQHDKPPKATTLVFLHCALKVHKNAAFGDFCGWVPDVAMRQSAHASRK